MSARRTILLGAIVWSGIGSYEMSRARAAAATAADLAWMEGHWTGVADGVTSEELWTSPRGGMLLGLHRDVRPDRRAFFEFLRIEEVDGGLVYQASPRGAPPTPFPAVEVTPSRVVFENPEHDFPQRISYEVRADTMRATVEGEVKGTHRQEQWVWTRMSAEEGR